MRLRLPRLVFVVVAAYAFLGAGLMRDLPSAQVETAGMAAMNMSMAADQGTDGAPMPCHGPQKLTPCEDKVPGCMSGLGCLFVVGIPVPHTRVAEHLAWGPVTYWATDNLAEGVTLEPYLGPPIRLV